MVGTRDIAAVAAQALRARDWRGVLERELLGPRDLTFSEATRILAQHLGRPDLKYVQVSCDDMAKTMVQAGMSESFATLYVEMARAFGEQKIKPSQGRTPENTAPTPFEDFASELAHVYAKAA